MKWSFLLFIGAANVLPVCASHVLHERRDAVPSSWSDGERLDERTVLPVRIGLTQSNLDIADDLLLAVYVSLSFLSVVDRVYLIQNQLAS